MSRMVGTVSMGIRAPIIRSGDDLVEIVTNSVLETVKDGALTIRDRDVIAMTEAIVARAQGNYASVDDIAADVRAKLGGETVGVLFPILSRNRFAICLRGIAKGARKVVLMLSYPSDEVGNHLIDVDAMDEKGVDPYKDVLTLERYRELFGYTVHPFTGVDYVDYYSNLIRESGAEVEVIFANDPRAILPYTKNVLACDIHTRARTKRRLLAAGAEIAPKKTSFASTGRPSTAYHELELAAMLAQAQGEVNLSMDFPEDDPRKYDVELIALAAGLRGRYEAQMEHYAFQDALVEVFKLIGRANKYIDENKPWALAKDEAQKPRLAHVLYNLLECVRLSAVLLTPFMPETCGKIFAQLGVDEGARTWESAGAWGLLPAGAAVSKGENLFPRIDVEKELAALDELQAEARRAALPAVEVEPFAQESVDFDTFCKSDFRAVKVKACESVKKSAKLLRFILDDGSGTDRQILSGIAMYYKPEELVGKTLVAIINLPPRKMMGQESCGMLLSAVHTEHGEEKLHLVMVDDAIPAGAKLC